MRKILLLTFSFFTLFFQNKDLKAQSCVPTNLNNTTINLSCGAPCTTLAFQVPHLKETSDYTVTSIPYNAFPYNLGTEINSIYQDDKYSNLLPLTFPFCFYGLTYNNIVVGSNGIATFESLCALASNAYTLTVGGAPQPLPYNLPAAPGGITTTYYPRGAIMGAYHDIDPSANPLPTRRIEYNVYGTAPCRKFVISFLDVRMFGSSCGDSIATSQIVLYESTGLIEVFLLNKPICTSWPSGAGGGLAILGIQDHTRTKFASPPGKNCTQWNEANTGYRFIPSGGVSKFVSSELLNMTGTILATADTVTTVAGLLDISFPNICPPPGATKYVVRTTFGSCPAGTSMVSLDTVTLSRNNTLPVTTVLAPTTCGNNTGSITVNVATGVGTTPYQYSINAGTLQSSNVFSGLAAGSYTVHATDATGCDTTYQVNIIASSSLTATFTSTNASCPGLNNGSITVTPTSGTAPYTFSANAGPAQPSGSFTSLAGGTYTIIYTDALLCTGSVTVVIGAGTPITANSTSTSTSCAGAPDGSITVTSQTGVGPFTYSLDGGAFQAGNVFTGVTSGPHSIVVRDSRGCTVTISRTVTAGTSLTGSIYTTPASCPGATDGTVTLVPNAIGGGTAPFTFSLNGGPFQASGTFTGLAASPPVYQVVFRDANGCTGNRSINVGSGVATSTGSNTTNTSCPGAPDGTITITPVAGAVYTLNPGNISNSTGIFTGLAAGSYTATYTIPPATCIGSVTPAIIVISAGPAIVGTATTIATSCPTVNDGTVTVTNPAGPGSTYTLNPGAVSNTTGIFTGLAPNTYTVTFVTASGCTGSVAPNPVVTAGPYLTSTFTQVNPVCANINDGSISITPQAGTPAPYNITLTGPGGPYTLTGNTPVVFTNLAPGTYNYSFSSANGCTGTGGPVVLTTNSSIMVPATLTMPLCNGNANGIVTFNPFGGVAPFRYSINAGVTYQASNTFNGLPAGNHTFRIMDNVGCAKDTTVTLTEPAILTSSASSTATAGCSNNDGVISAIANGGTTPYVYTIAGPTVNTTGAASSIFTGLANGNYSITATDTKGCTSTSTATVLLVDNMFLTPEADVTICVGSSTTFNPQTNPETSVFLWRSTNAAASTIANASIKNATVTPIDTAIYILNAKWGTCVREDTITVNVLHKPVPNAGKDTAICNISYAILRGSASNLSGTVNYTWSPATNVQLPTQAVTRVYPAGNDTTYTYTLTVTDNYGCNFSVTDPVNVRVQPPVPAYAGNDTIAVKGVPHQLFGSGGDVYLWSPSYPLNIAINKNPIATLENDTRFVLKVVDFAGCIGYDTVFVKVYFGPTYYIPNAFSPNSDGLNDIFRAIPVGIVNTEWFRIFNRYGEMIFQTNQWLKGWDGTFQGKKQPVGAYIWIIKGTDRNGKAVEMKGTVMLVQ